MSYDAPFAGLKVVDLSQGIAGPYCAALLAQHGATVIKVEPPGEGDWARTLGTRYGDHSAFSIIGNMGKRSIALDLKSAAGRDILWRLVEGADVFIEGFRPGVMQRLGFGWDAVSARAPRLIYLSISGFGQTGPLAERPAMDPVLQAYTGLMVENRGEDGIPHRVPVIVVDMSTALYAFQGLSAALYARRDETRGRYLDASLMQAATALQSIRLMATLLEGGPMRPGGAPGGVFRTADGWMSIVVTNDRDWRGVCEALGLQTLLQDRRYETAQARLDHADSLYAVFRPAVEALTSSELATRLLAGRLMHERLNSYAEFVEQEQVKATGLIQWVQQPGVAKKVPVPRLPGMRAPVDGDPLARAPTVGEDGAAILADHGYGRGEIAELSRLGAVVLKPDLSAA